MTAKQGNYTELDKKIALAGGRKCDKYDYLIAAFCGVSAGLVDAFFVGAPGEGLLGKNVDQAADIFVKKAAQTFWKFDRRPNKNKVCPETLDKCISYLEQAFPVPYDARYAKDLDVAGDVLAGMNPRNHHLLSLGHSPDIVGLLFSIIDQFTDMASFVDNGKVIRVYPSKESKAIPYLQGTDLPSRLFCGFVNWIGHIISDLVGSSSTRTPQKAGRGAGVPIPFFEMLLFCDFGDFDGQSFADIAVSVYSQGYDLRHGVKMAIPLLLSDLMVRVLWSLKQRFYHKSGWKECIPDGSHSDLRWMLIVSGGALCVIDASDAFIRSGGNPLVFFLHLNFIAWLKLVLMILKEVSIRYGFTYEDLKLQFQRINEELEACLARLQAIDYAEYNKEVEELQIINESLENGSNPSEEIYVYFFEHNIDCDWSNFDEFDALMKDDDYVLTI